MGVAMGDGRTNGLDGSEDPATYPPSAEEEAEGEGVLRDMLMVVAPVPSPPIGCLMRRGLGGDVDIGLL